MSINQDLIEDMYRSHYAALLAYALKYTLGDVAKAEDIVQETMLRAWLHAEEFTDAQAARPWLFTVTRRVAIDKVRLRATHPVEANGELLALRADPDDPIESALAALDVQAALTRLPADHRDVLISLYLHERTVAETATRMSIPPGTVKSRAFHALRKARVAIDQPRPDRNHASTSCRASLSLAAAVNPA